MGRGHRSFRDPDYLEICVPEDRFVIFGAAQRQAESQHRAFVARLDRLTRLSKYCGFALMGLLLISGGVWVYRGIVAVNGGRTP